MKMQLIKKVRRSFRLIFTLSIIKSGTTVPSENAKVFRFLLEVDCPGHED